MFQRIFGPDQQRAAETAEASQGRQTRRRHRHGAPHRGRPRGHAARACPARRLGGVHAGPRGPGRPRDQRRRDGHHRAELQDARALDEATAILVAEMASSGRNVGGTEDYVVVREFAKLATDQQKQDVLRACFAVAAASGSISAEESAEVNQIANELDLDAAESAIRAEFHELLSSVQAVRRHRRSDRLRPRLARSQPRSSSSQRSSRKPGVARAARRAPARRAAARRMAGPSVRPSRS